MSNQLQKIDWSEFFDPDDIEEEDEEEFFDSVKEYGIPARGEF